MESERFELSAFCLQSSCSPNWATTPKCGPSGNRNHPRNLARVSRLPWHMPAHNMTIVARYCCEHITQYRCELLSSKIFQYVKNKNFILILERVTGIEPVSSGWKPEIIVPLYDTRNFEIYIRKVLLRCVWRLISKAYAKRHRWFHANTPIGCNGGCHCRFHMFMSAFEH